MSDHGSGRDDLDELVQAFAVEVGPSGPVTIAGSGTRGGGVDGIRCVSAPSGIAWIQPAEMTMRCAAGTPFAEVEGALAEHRQCVAMPSGGTIGGALAVGHSGLRRLGWGPVRDTLLQARYVSAAGEIVKGGGPTVKNVSGFDLCRLLVGSQGTLGFLADVILRTRPLPAHEQWFVSRRDPWALLGELYRPTSMLWDGESTWTLLEGHRDDVLEQAAVSELVANDGPPTMPSQRWSVAPSKLTELRDVEPGTFVAEIGVGIVHGVDPRGPADPDPAVVELHRRIKDEFDPTGRLNPGVDVLAAR